MPPWQCKSCNTHCKASAEFCASCGSHWSQKPYAGSWARPQSQGRAYSPGRYHQSPRPRRRGRGKGDQPKGRGEQPRGGKGKQAETPPEAPVVKAPSLEQLPAPPAAAATSAPKAAGGPSTAASSTPEKQQLDALLKILRTTKTPLPSEAQQMMEQLQQNQSQQEAKNMHRAVSQQSTAKKELERVRAARSLFLQQWAQYISGLADLLQQQMEEQEETLASFDQKEAQWQEALAKSSAELKQLTDCPTLDVQEVQESEDEMEVQAAEEMVDKAIAEEQQMKARREEQRQQSKQLQATLETMKQQAQHRAEEAKRDGSRTPRRQTSQQAADGPTTEAKGDDKKPKDAEAKASAVPGQAR